MVRGGISRLRGSGSLHVHRRVPLSSQALRRAAGAKGKR